jgi:hypothetical protein
LHWRRQIEEIFIVVKVRLPIGEKKRRPNAANIRRATGEPVRKNGSATVFCGISKQSSA